MEPSLETPKKKPRKPSETTIAANTETAHAQTSPAATYSLDQLAALDVQALNRIYASGTVPKSLTALDGHPRGRMLAVKTLEHTPLWRFVRQFAGAASFPWGGKSFHADSKTAGTGINRVHLGGRHQLFPFKTLFGASKLDGQPAIILNYDLSDNPSFIRRIHDEVREVSPGLFLGPAMWKTEADPTFVLWFAIDTNTQSDAIGSH